jgi:hypothetical protein
MPIYVIFTKIAPYGNLAIRIRGRAVPAQTPDVVVA